MEDIIDKLIFVFFGLLLIIGMVSGILLIIMMVAILGVMIGAPI